MAAHLYERPLTAVADDHVFCRILGDGKWDLFGKSGSMNRALYMNSSKHDYWNPLKPQEKLKLQH
ncbi:MAG: hypothetical protein VYE00_16170 [Candidatus Poribacteria bacterium]|nr:hypothetical protein [Candidatus Poribacteria bacterium]